MPGQLTVAPSMPGFRDVTPGIRPSVTGLAVQNYATYPSMPGALRALCPDFRGVITGIRPYARYQHWCFWVQALVFLGAGIGVFAAA